MRDAFIARMYDTGVPEQPLLAELDDTQSFYKKFEKAFSKNVIGPAPGTLGIAGSLNKLNRQNVDITSSFVQLEKAALDPTTGIKDDFRKTITRPLRTSADNVLQLKLASRGAAKGTRKLAKGAIPPEVLEAVLSGIADIPDEVTRDAVMASLLGYRGTDLSGIRTSRALATRAGTPRPYYDRETGITRDPDVAAGRGRKGAGPDKPPGPVLRAILDRRFDAAGDTGELFPDINTGKISSALKKHVFSKIPKDVLDNLLTKPTGYTDLRRITASAIANQLGRPDLASQIISHKGDDVIDVVMTGYYTDVEDLSGLEQRGQILSAYEKMMADAVGATDAKGLGESLNLNLPEEFNASYTDIDISSPSVAPLQPTTATPEEIEQGQALRAAKTAQAVSAAELASQEAAEKAEDVLLRRAARADDVAQAEVAVSTAKTTAKRQSSIASGQSILDDAINNFGKPIAKVITDPKINKALLYGAITGSAVAASRTAEAQGDSPFMAGMKGVAAGASELIPIPGFSYSDTEFRASQQSTAPGGSGLGPRTDVDTQMNALGYIRPEFASYPMEAAPTNIPEPTVTRTTALEAEGASEK